MFIQYLLKYLFYRYIFKTWNLLFILWTILSCFWNNKYVQNIERYTIIIIIITIIISRGCLGKLTTTSTRCVWRKTTPTPTRKIRNKIVKSSQTNKWKICKNAKKIFFKHWQLTWLKTSKKFHNNCKPEDNLSAGSFTENGTVSKPTLYQSLHQPFRN